MDHFDSAARLMAGDRHMSPRMRLTLTGLLRGDSEKEVAISLGISPHTVHIYVKSLYRMFEVSSKGELFARFINLAAVTFAAAGQPDIPQRA
jgi:DNA-binding CsgD family transcriptional regulator